MNTYILNGHEPVRCDDSLVWGEWFRKGDRIVARTKVGACEVSTVFLGLDHQYRDGPPLLFETMIFGGVFEDDEYQTRCSTWDEAEKMHAAACDAARGAP